MCKHIVLRHGIGCQAVCTLYIFMETNIQAPMRKLKFHHLTYLKEARFAHQLKNLFRIFKVKPPIVLKFPRQEVKVVRFWLSMLLYIVSDVTYIQLLPIQKFHVTVA